MKNIIDPDPLKPGEQQRIQNIINRKLAKETLICIDNQSNITESEVSPVWHTNDKKTTFPLGDVVAQEKARNIKKQRRSIQCLDPEQLKKMVLRIFSDINCEKYEDGKVAQAFGISKATFSRFAGSRWKNSKTIPDLWKNTARVLLVHSSFKETLEQFRTLKHIKETIEVD